jgi:hypothetical protein
MATKSLSTRVVTDISLALQPFGFKRQRNEGIFLLSVREGWFGWLGLNARVHKGYCELNPVVGVRYTELERLSATLRGAKYVAYSPPSLSTTLRFLMENRGRWEFYNDIDPSPVVSNMVTAIVEVGVPFMKDHCTLESVVSKLTPWSQSDAKGDAYRYPAALLLLGKADEAIDYLKKKEKSLPASPAEYSYSDQYREFVVRFFDLIQNKPPCGSTC